MNKKLNTTAIEYQYRVRQQAKARTKRFREEQEKRGYKNLTVYLSEAFRDELKRLSDEKGLNRQAAMDHVFDIYQQAANGRVTSNVTLGKEKNVESPDSSGPVENQMEMFDKMPDQINTKTDQDINLPDYLIDVKPNMPIEERHQIILRLAEDFPGRAKGMPQKRIDMLNTAGILLNGKPWEKTKQFADQLSIARRWAKKQEAKKKEKALTDPAE